MYSSPKNEREALDFRHREEGGGDDRRLESPFGVGEAGLPLR